MTEGQTVARVTMHRNVDGFSFTQDIDVVDDQLFLFMESERLLPGTVTFIVDGVEVTDG